MSIDGGAGCIAPTDETINNGSYAPLSRPLFIYVRADAAQERHVAEFVRYYLSADGQELAASVGYIPFQQQVYDLGLAQVQQWRLDRHRFRRRQRLQRPRRRRPDALNPRQNLPKRRGE